MNNTHSTDTENKTHVPDSGIGAMIGEEEYLTNASSGDIAKMASGDNPPLTPQNVMALQRNLGNQATLNIINRAPQLTTQNNTNPFAGLKMVTPQVIQRAGGDNPVSEEEPNNLGDDDNDTTDPNAAVELDGSDQEVQQENNEIDQTISEAQQLPGMLNAPKNAGSNPDDNASNANPSSNVAVDIDDDDPDNDDDDGSGYASAQQSAIKQKQTHQQLKGTKVPGTKGHQLSGTGFFPSVGQGLVDAGRNTSTVLEAKEAVGAIESASSLNEALANVADTSTDIGSNSVSELLEKVMAFFDTSPINVILPIATLVYRVMAAITKHTHMKAFKALMSNNKGDVKSAKDRSTALKDKGTIGAYGFAKTKRGFWLRVIKAAINVGQVLSRLVTLITGGTAALISEAVNTALSLSNGVIKIGQSLKGIYKMIVGKRGKRRLESANWIVDAAIDGDTEMLQFLIDGEALSKVFLYQRNQDYRNEAEISTDKDRLAKLKILASDPQTTDDMLKYLKTAEELDKLKAVKQQVSIMTRST